MRIASAGLIASVTARVSWIMMSAPVCIVLWNINLILTQQINSTVLKLLNFLENSAVQI